MSPAGIAKGLVLLSQNWQNGGYISLLAEKCFKNKYWKVYIFAKLNISASRKYILLHTYFIKVFQYVELYQLPFANSRLSKTSRNAGQAHI